MKRPITNAQIRAIKCRQRTLDMDDDAYRAMLRGRYGVATCKALTAAQAHNLIDHLYGGAKPRSRRRIQNPAATPAAAKSDNVVRLPSGPQMRLIGVLIGEIAWQREDGYQRWLKRSLGLNRVRSAGDARLVIEGLKGLKSHGHC